MLFNILIMMADDCKHFIVTLFSDDLIWASRSHERFALMKMVEDIHSDTSSMLEENNSFSLIFFAPAASLGQRLYA